jgi:hypothetical protein
MGDCFNESPGFNAKKLLICRMKFIKLITLFFIVLSFQNCTKTTPKNDVTELDIINTEIRVHNINNYLTELGYTKDSLFYRNRKDGFDLLEEGNSIDILKTYIAGLKADFENKKSLPPTFKKQIKCLEEDCEKLDARLVYQRIVEVEEQLYNHYAQRTIYFFNGIDRILSSIVPFKSNLTLGEKFDARAGVYAYNQDGRKWLSNANIYYVNGDTTLLKSYSDTLSSSNAYFDIAFGPGKRGSYLVKGSFLVFVDNQYYDIPFETTFTVK